MTQLPMVHPEVARLCDECARLEAEIARMIAVNMELTSTVIPNLEADYVVKVGALKFELFVLQGHNQRRRRKIEMLRACLNRGEAPCVASIEAALDEMFVRWAAEVHVKHRELEQARQVVYGPCVDPEIVAEVKKIYRELVKRLHPDLHPELGDKGLQWWFSVVTAYEAFDLQALRDIQVLLEGFGEAPSLPNRLDDLRARRDHLREYLDRIQGIHVRLYSEFPLIIQRELADEAWVAARNDDIQASIEAEKRAAVMLEAQLAVLTGAVG